MDSGGRQKFDSPKVDVLTRRKPEDLVRIREEDPEQDDVVRDVLDLLHPKLLVLLTQRRFCWASAEESG